MQAGKQRAVLPLIRKFNEHSSRLLNTVLYVCTIAVESTSDVRYKGENLLQNADD